MSDRGHELNAASASLPSLQDTDSQAHKMGAVDVAKAIANDPLGR